MVEIIISGTAWYVISMQPVCTVVGVYGSHAEAEAKAKLQGSGHMVRFGPRRLVAVTENDPHDDGGLTLCYDL